MARIAILLALSSATAVAGPQIIEDKAVEVVGLDDAVQLATSEYAPRTCARRANGHVACWGGHLTGKSMIFDPKPIEVPGLTDAVDLVVSVHNACARRRGGQVVCWGAKDADERVVWTRPTPVPALAKTTVLFGDAMTCGAGAGVLACTHGKDSVFHAPEGPPTRAWRGMNGRSTWRCFEVEHKIGCEQSFVERHGDGTSIAPEGTFGTLDGALDLALPSNEIDTTCVVRGTGTVECHAYGDPPGQFEPIPTLTDVVALQLGCALRRDGTVACWDEGTRKRDAIVPVAGVTDAVELVGGDAHHCVRRKTGHVACWGYIGTLGDGRK